MRSRLAALAAFCLLLSVATIGEALAGTDSAAGSQEADALCHRFAADPSAGTGPQEWSHPFGSIDPFRALPPCKAAVASKPDDKNLILANAMAYIAWRKNDEARPMLEHG